MATDVKQEPVEDTDLETRYDTARIRSLLIGLYNLK